MDKCAGTFPLNILDCQYRARIHQLAIAAQAASVFLSKVEVVLEACEEVNVEVEEAWKHRDSYRSNKNEWQHMEDHPNVQIA